MGLLEGELWSTDKDVHNKTYMNDHQENDVLYKKTVETHTHLLKRMVLPEILTGMVNPLTYLL